MSILPNFLRSLFVTAVLSFVTPLLITGLIIVALVGVSYVPGLAVLGKIFVSTVIQFLATFGSGSPWEGILIISLTCGLVGSLFNLFTFYRHQYLGGN